MIFHRIYCEGFQDAGTAYPPAVRQSTSRGVHRIQWVARLPLSPGQPRNPCLRPCLQLQFNTLRPRQDGRHFPDDIFKCIFLNENARILIKISLMFVPKDSIDNIPTLVQIMAWRRPGGKPLSEPMVVSLPTHICVARPQWVKCTLTTDNWCS